MRWFTAMRALALCPFLMAAPSMAVSATGTAPASMGDVLLLPDKVWTGEGDASQSGIAVLVHDGAIAAVGRPEKISIPAGTRRIELPGATLT